MQAYKFRSAAQIGFVFDVLLNRRLRCSPWNRLNDPMEGMFGYESKGEAELSWVERQVLGVVAEKKRYRVCSLAGTFDCHLLWAHYAGGFDGVAIEVDLPDDDLSIKAVEYRGVFAFLSDRQLMNEQEAARSILFSKYKEWEYEREIRILGESDWYELQRPVKRVIAGHRMEPALFKALHLVCDKLGIDFRKVGIGDEGIDADDPGKLDLRVFRKPPSRVPKRPKLHLEPVGG